MKNSGKKTVYIVGLGNAEPTYRHTYHNVGFLFIEWVLKTFNVSENARGIAHMEHGGHDLIFIRPQGFMNESGPALAQRINKVQLRNAIVVHDDSDLLIGSLKWSFDRGAAGHKGVLSIMETMKQKEFYRLRIGIRPEAPIRLKAEAFVLKKITPAHAAVLEEMFKRCWEIIEKQLTSDS